MTSLRTRLDGCHRVAWRVWRGAHRFFVATSVLCLLLSSAVVAAEQPAPRTISDITALLDQHKPDPVKVQELKLAASREPPAGADKETLANFHYERAEAAQLLGMVTRQLEDLRHARALAPAGGLTWRRATRSLGHAERANGNFINAFTSREELRAHTLGPGEQLSNHTVFVSLYLAIGDMGEARAALKNAEILLSNLQRNPRAWGAYGDLLLALYESARAGLLTAEGKTREAESTLRSTMLARERWHAVAPQMVRTIGTTVETSHNAYDNVELRLAANLTGQGRLAEAELAVRNVLKSTLSRLGRYSPGTAEAVAQFASVLAEQGRPRDAEVMARAAIDIHKQLGSAAESRELAQTRRMLGAALVSQSRWTDAAAVYEEMRSGLADNPALLQVLAHGDVNWALALIKTKRAADAVALLDPVVKTNTERLGREHYQPAEQRGFLAMALAESGERPRALAEYREAVRVLLTPGLVVGEDADASPARLRRLTLILEGYIKLLYETQGDASTGIDAATEAFRVADATRAHSVQSALSASAARAAAGTPALAELVRREQDAKQQLSVLYATLVRMLNAPPDQQLPQVTAQMRTRIAELEKEQRGMAAEVQKRFPAYAELVNPRPATLDQARAALREGEVLLSVLTTQERTYVWAVPKHGAVAFHAAAMGEAEINQIVAGLRRSLDVGTVAITRVPEFDVGQAAKLYDTLLKPVEGAWKGAQALLVVANGGLAQLPFGVLPIATVAATAQGLRFEQYKSVPWLIKLIAVTQLPAVNTLVTLRGLPQGNAQRTAFAGFGDPQFDTKQAAAPAPMQVAMRNMDIRRITEAALRDGSAPANYIPYSALPPLPDTRDEILAIAQALKADINRDVFLGLAASKQSLKTANLANRRIVAFATHGLVPGDFPNLDQPALALSSPDGKAETGLLTLEDILQLKLDADWVVLSACNTGAGDGAGAEAISGLGRGFFYAGSRALLVTHWPVETVSAKNLVTRLFERYAADNTLTRAEALRRAHLAVMDDNAIEGGKPAYSYAHPLFWAPYALVGDGGR